MAKESPVTIEVETKGFKSSEMVMLAIEVPTVYANNTQIRFTNWDASFLFGEIAGQEQGADERMVIKPRVKIAMSHQHAKAFLEAFTTSLAAFEAQLGEITIPGKEGDQTNK